MKAFLDTSSLVKLYHQEESSDFVTEVLSNDVEEIFLSELAVLEFQSALWKKIREKEITEKAALEVIEGFRDDSDKFHMDTPGIRSCQISLSPADEIRKPWLKNIGFPAIGNCLNIEE